jgi:hypothetical protein
MRIARIFICATLALAATPAVADAQAADLLNGLTGMPSTSAQPSASYTVGQAAAEANTVAAQEEAAQSKGGTEETSAPVSQPSQLDRSTKLFMGVMIVLMLIAFAAMMRFPETRNADRYYRED